MKYPEQLKVAEQEWERAVLGANCFVSNGGSRFPSGSWWTGFRPHWGKLARDFLN